MYTIITHVDECNKYNTKYAAHICAYVNKYARTRNCGGRIEKKN